MGFGSGPLLGLLGTLQLLDPTHVWERGKALLRGVLVGGGPWLLSWSTGLLPSEPLVAI